MTYKDHLRNADKKIMPNRHEITLHAKSFLSSPLRYFTSWWNFYRHGSQVERWSNFDNFDPSWDERTAIIGGMIAPHSSVLEFASAKEQLDKFLPEGCTYQPSDLVKRSERTLVCDLNAGFPDLEQHYDVIVLPGILEYIYDLESLFTEVRKHCTECIVVYAPTDFLNCVATRITHGWVNHLSQALLLDLFKKSGFQVVETKSWRVQNIYRLK